MSYLLTISYLLIMSNRLNVKLALYNNYYFYYAGARSTGRWDEIPYPCIVHDATLRPLLNIMDSASHNPVAEATAQPAVLSPVVI